MIKRLFVFLILSISVMPAHAALEPWKKSPELEALIVKLNAFYDSPDRSDFNQLEMNRADNLAFFIRHVDRLNSPEYAPLQAYLLGVQAAYVNGFYEQKQQGRPYWFCLPEGEMRRPSVYSKRPTLFMENFVYEVIEIELKENPNTYDAYGGAPALTKLTGLIHKGLKQKYPCNYSG